MNRLYPHNEQAVKAVAEAFKTQQRAAVVHATGTGKSYIIASVVKAYGKAIVIAPNTFVLNETRKVCKKGTDFMTYTYVAHRYEELPHYDLIVCDEFHRAGAPEWGKGVQNLIAANPNAKVLGTSANYVRYLDSNRNMVEEMFEGNMVSYISLGDAISDGLLPMPTYVCSLYTMDETVKQLTQHIKTSIKTDAEKEDGLRKLQGIQANWEHSHGIADIIRKYVPKDMHRMIAFCQNIANIAEAEVLLHKWFYDAGFGKIKFYRITSDEDNTDKEMEQFCADDYNGLKICLSVNMLNEGVHVPGVEGIIMMRSTMSRIMAEQQVGRCLTTSNRDRKPVVIDLVNNVYYFRDRYNIPKQEGTSKRKRTKTQAQQEEAQFSFDIIDECRDIREFVGGLYDTFDSNRWDYESAKAAAAKCSHPYEFMQKYSGAYQWAHRNGVVEEITAHMTRQKQYKWTKEELIANAKKYKTPYEWEEADKRAYCAALNRDDYMEITAHMIRQVRHSKAEWMEICSHYEYIEDFKADYPKAAATMYKHGVWKECTAHMKRRPKPIKVKVVIPTDKEIIAQLKQYKTREQVIAENKHLYYVALRRKLQEEIDNIWPRVPYVRHTTKWTREKIIETIKDNNITSRKQLGKISKAAKNAAKRLGILDELLPIQSQWWDGEWQKENKQKII